MKTRYKTSEELISNAMNYNYVRPHMALDNETPADRVGIKIKGKNKWLTLIQNASKQQD